MTSFNGGDDFNSSGSADENAKKQPIEARNVIDDVSNESFRIITR